MKKIIGIVLASILALSVVGCDSTDNKNSDPVNDKKEEVMENHKIGEVVKISEDEKVTVSVLNARKVKDEVYAIELEIVNKGENDVESDFINNYKLIDSNGYECGQLLNQDIKGQLMYDTIHPNSTLKGEIAYELKDAATPKEFEIDLGLGYYTIFDIKIN